MHCQDRLAQAIERRKKGGCGGKEVVEKPEIIKDYNCFMGGVDVVDQHLVYCGIGRKGLKWWRCVFYHLLEMAIVNSYAIYPEKLLLLKTSTIPL